MTDTASSRRSTAMPNRSPTNFAVASARVSQALSQSASSQPFRLLIQSHVRCANRRRKARQARFSFCVNCSYRNDDDLPRGPTKAMRWAIADCAMHGGAASDLWVRGRVLSTPRPGLLYAVRPRRDRPRRRVRFEHGAPRPLAWSPSRAAIGRLAWNLAARIAKKRPPPERG